MSGMKKGKLIITLKSDLCAGSGYSYAGIVDSDTSYDEYGLPYIPAKRLKGCIRETVETTLYGEYPSERVEAVFGVKGSKQGATLKIDNAYVKDSECIREYLSDNPVITSQDALERFTHVTGQTKLENGIADPGSLRYTRVVNHYSPIDGEEMVFTADFVCDSDDWDMLKEGARATRHIGLKRNRGFGNIRIDVEEVDKPGDDSSGFVKIMEKGDGTSVLFYAVENIQPLMLSRSMEDESSDYIPGQQVLGMLASKYLQDASCSDKDEAFKALFLDGSTRFSNLYPYDGNSIYYPAPDYINRLKKTKKLVYNIEKRLPKEEDITNEDFKYGGGNQPKKLKGKYLVWQPDNKVAVYEVKKDVMYHHSHRNTHEITVGKESRDEGILYSMEVIRRGQMFAGYITVSTEYADFLSGLLNDGRLYFGKSKTAQYGMCKLLEYKGDQGETGRSFEPESYIVVTFLSDTILNRENGTPTVFYDEVREAVKKELVISAYDEGTHNEELAMSEDEKKVEYISSIQTTTATGYLSKWNLRKPVVPAVKAGSFITFRLSAPLSWDKSFIGERTLEGYGQIRIDDASRCDYDGLKEEYPQHEGKMQKKDIINDEITNLIRPILYDRWLEGKIYDAINGKNKVEVSNTAAGRFLLMLRESVNEKEKYDDAFREFGKRIDSIKTESTREEGRRLLKKIGKTNDSGEWLISDESVFSQMGDDLSKDLKDAGLEDVPAERYKRWDQYIMAILTDRKYKGRGE